MYPLCGEDGRAPQLHHLHPARLWVSVDEGDGGGNEGVASGKKRKGKERRKEMKRKE